MKGRKSLEKEQLNEVMYMYQNSAALMPRYEQDDGFEWDDYERFAINPNGVKLKDLNRKNLRHI